LRHLNVSGSPAGVWQGGRVLERKAVCVEKGEGRRAAAEVCNEVRFYQLLVHKVA
jgi:hypothetical protein